MALLWGLPGHSRDTPGTLPGHFRDTPGSGTLPGHSLDNTCGCRPLVGSIACLPFTERTAGLGSRMPMAADRPELGEDRVVHESRSMAFASVFDSLPIPELPVCLTDNDDSASATQEPLLVVRVALVFLFCLKCPGTAGVCWLGVFGAASAAQARPKRVLGHGQWK